jgi:cysteinyl-tRNA synthetase
VLQLDLTRESVEPDVPRDVADLAARRDAARAERDFITSDRLRAQIESLGWQVEDTPNGTKLRKISPILGGGA